MCCSSVCTILWSTIIKVSIVTTPIFWFILGDKGGNYNKNKNCLACEAENYIWRVLKDDINQILVKIVRMSDNI